jgi:hypothetical protein
MEYKVLPIHSRWRKNGEWNEERKQYLKQKVYTSFAFGLFKWTYWKTIDSEIVPQHVWLQNAIFGSDIEKWKSKFSKYI